MTEKEKETIEDIIAQRKKAHGFYAKNSKVYNAFVNMEQKTFRDASLRKKDKELIAIGISVVINCESCMEWHIKEALADGATREEVLEAVEVGIEMSGGPGTVAARFALLALEYHSA